MKEFSQTKNNLYKFFIFHFNLNFTNRQTQNKEITVLRSKLVEYESDTDRLKRQLTNERFERERAAQELRKIAESNELSRYTSRNISPARTSCPCPPPPPPISLPLPLPGCIGGSAASAAVAAASAAVAASNVA